MAKVYLICGRLCCGKTTYAHRLRLEKNGVLLSVDELMLTLFGQHCGEKHDDYAERTKAYLLQKAQQLLECGIDVILDWGVWSKAGRQEIKNYFSARDIPMELHYLDVPDDLWRERLKRRNQNVCDGTAQAYFVDDNLLAKFESRFEQPKKEEIDVWITQEDNYG